MGKPPYSDLTGHDLELAQRWLDAMAWLRHAADPTQGRRFDTNVSKSADKPIPGQSTRRYRNAVRRIRAGMETLCEKAELALDDPTTPRKGRLWCPKCGRGGRPGAELCDRRECAGVELEER